MPLQPTSQSEPSRKVSHLNSQEKHAFSKCYTTLHTRLQLMWIESILGHSFLACNLLWPCSLIETSDTELRSRKVSYLKSRVSHWSGEKQNRWKDTTRRARPVLLRNQFEPSYVTSAPLLSAVLTSKYIYIYINKPWSRFASACAVHAFGASSDQDSALRASKYTSLTGIIRNFWKIPCYFLKCV